MKQDRRYKESPFGFLVLKYHCEIICVISLAGGLSQTAKTEFDDQ